MVNDGDARRGVRRLVQRLQNIADQSTAMAYVLARHDPKEYARLLRAAEIAEETVIRPLADREQGRRQVYAALEDPVADWTEAVNGMLDRGLVCFTGDEVLAHVRFVQSLDKRFDAKMKTETEKRGE